MKKELRKQFAQVVHDKRASGAIRSFPLALPYFALLLKKNEQITPKNDERIPNPAPMCSGNSPLGLPHVLRQLATWSPPCAHCSGNSPCCLPQCAQTTHHMVFHQVHRQITTWSSTMCSGNSPHGLPPYARSGNLPLGLPPCAQPARHVVCWTRAWPLLLQ